MSQFSNENDLLGSSAGFFRRLRKGVTDTLQIPSTTAPSSTDLDSTSSTNSTASSTVSSNNGEVDGPADGSTPIREGDEVCPPVHNYRMQQYELILGADNIDLGALRKLSWNGVPYQYRAVVWQLLLGYLPTHKGRREQTISRKRKEYADAIHNYYEVANLDRDSEMMRQILVDLPRTSPDLPFFQQGPIQKSMERILCIWATRHPASGYVQGMNDLLTPLLIINLIPYVINNPLVVNKTHTISDVLRCDVSGIIEPSVLMHVECDAYWCLTKLLDNIQDHYTDAQPGLQRMGVRLEDLMKRIDNELHAHFETEGLLYVQFSFRWMNCLLLRELPLRAILRVWDTYLSEERGGFENFHVYVCAVLLKTFRDMLLDMPFQDMILLLQV